MENKVIDIILARMDKLENKIDVLIAFKWQIVGGSILASLILTVAFQLLNAWIKK